MCASTSPGLGRELPSLRLGSAGLSMNLSAVHGDLCCFLFYAAPLRTGRQRRRKASGECPSSCRPGSKRRGRAGRRKIRNRRVKTRALTPLMRLKSLSPRPQTPTAVVAVWWCDISGTRLFVCRRRALRTNGDILCRCTRRWAWATPSPIRINLWRVRKFRIPAKHFLAKQVQAKCS